MADSNNIKNHAENDNKKKNESFDFRGAIQDFVEKSTD
jgi:hypothetical protein